MQTLLQLGQKPKSSASLVPLRFRDIKGDVLLTSYFGDWIFVSKPEFNQLMGGQQLEPELERRLTERNFLKKHVDADRLSERLAHKSRFMQYGPNLHIIVVTLRCNETCVYCHASRANMDQTETDMSAETAEKTVDLILNSTSPRVTIEFQGGEPLAHFERVKHIVNYALERNRAVGKDLEFTMVTNLSLMTDEKLDFLIDKKVQLCTSIDGPEVLHNKQRILPTGSAFQHAAGWIKKINSRYEDLGLDPVLYRVEALLTTTRRTLEFPKEVVDTYVELGCRSMFLRPVDPFGFADKTASKIRYEQDRYLDFYAQALAHILDLNKQGVQVLERFAAIFLMKILTGDDPNFVDIRSPCGAGIGQVAYNYDGHIFTCDEGRMLHEMGDDTFKIGSVGDAKYRDMMNHETVRSLLVASNLNAQPDCVNCTYNPYCGVCPVHNYATQGSIHGRMRESALCSTHKGIQDVLFGYLKDDDPATVEIFRRWTTVRERAHFLHACSAS